MPLPLDCDENVHLRILMVGFIVLFLWIIFQIIMLALHVILSYNLDSLWAIYILKFEPWILNHHSSPKIHCYRNHISTPHPWFPTSQSGHRWTPFTHSPQSQAINHHCIVSPPVPTTRKPTTPTTYLKQYTQLHPLTKPTKSSQTQLHHVLQTHLNCHHCYLTQHGQNPINPNHLQATVVQ